MSSIIPFLILRLLRIFAAIPSWLDLVAAAVSLVADHPAHKEGKPPLLLGLALRNAFIITPECETIVPPRNP